MPFYGGTDPIGKHLMVVGDDEREIRGVAWVDTEWGLLKIVDTRYGGREPVLEQLVVVHGFLEWRARFTIVQRNFKLIDRRTNKVLHDIVVVIPRACVIDKQDVVYDLVRA